LYNEVEADSRYTTNLNQNIKYSIFMKKSLKMDFSIKNTPKTGVYFYSFVTC